MNGKLLMALALVGVLAGAGYFVWSNKRVASLPAAGSPNTPSASPTPHSENGLAKAADPSSGANPSGTGVPKDYAAKPAPERIKIVAELGRRKAEPGVKTGLLSALDQEQDPAVKAEVVRALGLAYRGDPEAVLALTRCLGEAQPDAVREEATKGLHDLGEDGRPAVEALVRLLEQDEYRLPALQVLGGIGPAATEALKPIAQCLESKRVLERAAALKALARMGPAAATALGTPDSGIVGRLKDPDPAVRAQAANALKRIGKEAQRPEIRGLLEPLLKDPDEGVRRAAQGAYEKLFAGA